MTDDADPVSDDTTARVERMLTFRAAMNVATRHAQALEDVTPFARRPKDLRRLGAFMLERLRRDDPA